ncbi:hypothetical protein [Microbacterium sp. Bi128]|uniref:hypothetical protein n=1 Tax=Microbacterium sp. Bi128 TaxID=2821115 RepID=UPI001DC0C739|nr:hypothetical protein [Microbacterium sp. Bi128]CAH0144826.1 hypothetical protein SRABI128_00390 [Microbacterium sp. Bi128]
MTTGRDRGVDYATHCTVCIIVIDGDIENKVVYERAQPQIPDRPLTPAEREHAMQFLTDAELTNEAKWIFDDMKSKGTIGAQAELGGVFIARTAAAALEMNL